MLLMFQAYLLNFQDTVMLKKFPILASFQVYILFSYQTREAGLVLSVTRILRAALSKFRVYVCMCV